MRKNIIKYLKFFISIMLIFSLLIPSYAITSGDGSDFVTKQEFDAFAGKIIQRLNTFETGLASKIDTQVVSYLDKNGIWSGKYQTLSGSWTLQSGTEGTYKKKSSWNSGSGSKTSADCLTNWIDTYGFVSAYNTKNMLGYKIIDKLTKSGLVCFTIQTEPNDSSGRSGFIGKFLLDTTVTELHQVACPNITVDLVWSEEDSSLTALPEIPEEKARIRLTTGDFTLPRSGGDSSSYSGGYVFSNFHIALGKQNVYYFATKGNSIWIYYNFVMSYKSEDNMSKFLAKKSSWTASSGSSTLYLNYTASACVY